jgi:hypothetical protein
MSAELGISIAGVSIDLIIAIAAVLSIILGAINTIILVLQSWLDRHKVHRLVITKETEQKKKENTLYNTLSKIIADSQSAGSHPKSTPERESDV